MTRTGLPRPRNARTVQAICLVLGVLCLGCTRPYWHRQADQAAWRLTQNFAAEAGEQLRDDVSLPRPESRLFDPYSFDFPPLPPDDPLAHTRMHCIDGKRTYNWHKNGETPQVDPETWRAYLPCDEQGRHVIDLDGAVQLAYLHSREYRKELEDLYLSALDVSFERFRFDAQFFFSDNVFMTADGPRRSGGDGESSSILRTEADASMNKLYAAGGQLVVDMANTIVWQFAGSNTNSNTTLLDFSFIQPLLRLGGRARILERLTLVERQLIYNVRQMEQYRQGFYAQVTTGRTALDGPNRRGGVSGAGLQGFTGFGGGFGRINTATPTASGVVDAGGFLGLLQDQIQIRNQEANVTTLRDSLARLQAEFEADRIKDKFQVELARQALYDGQSKLLASKAAYQSKLDTFKVFLGLPPHLEIDIRDPRLDQFELIDPAASRLTERAGRIALLAHSAPEGVTPTALAELLDGDDGVRAGVERHLEQVRADVRRLHENLPRRERQLRRLLERPEMKSGDLPVDAYSPEALAARYDALTTDLETLSAGLAETWRQLGALRNKLPEFDRNEAVAQLDRIHPVLSSRLLALSLAQARARVDTIVWTPIEITWEDAYETARMNRRDWMNARGNLVDTWRLIEYNANALKSGLNLVFSGDISTLHDNPLAFRDTTGRLRAGVQFDAPLTRIAERNIYRQSLIEYQQARRNFMLFEDRVCQSLRNVLRTIELNQLNFEIRRSALQVAIQQVDLARETLTRPLRPGEQPTDYAAARASIGRDLVTALNALLDGQNNFNTVWVSYEVNRISLDLEMGTMQLDDRGLWIDPGPVTGSYNTGRLPEDDLPIEPVPILKSVEELPALPPREGEAARGPLLVVPPMP